MLLWVAVGLSRIIYEYEILRSSRNVWDALGIVRSL
jgi:hypothetical protein